MDKFDFLNSKNDAITLKRNTVTSFIGNMGIIVAAMTLLCTCVMFFTDISLASLVTAEFSLSFVILLFCSYTMYFSMADTGAKHGAECEGYKKARERYETIRAELGECGMLFKLGYFCQNYVKSELEATQRSILLSAGIEYEQYCALYKGLTARQLPKNLSSRTRRTITRANRLKPIVLTPDMLLSDGAHSHTRNPLTRNPVRSKMMHSLKALIPTTVTSFFAVSVVCSVISDPSMATVTECFIKLFALVWNGCKGYTMGYNNTSVEYCAYLASRSDLLHAARLSLTEKRHEATETLQSVEAGVNVN